MDNHETLKILFALHHEQYATRWRNITTTTQGTTATFTLLTGWVLLAKNAPSVELLPWITVFILVLAFMSCAYILISIKNVRTIASVIVKINSALGLHESGRFIPDEPLYPKRWKSFGVRRRGEATGFILLVLIAAVMAIGAVYSRV